MTLGGEAPMSRLPNELTPRQQEVFRFIVRFIESHNYSPTVRDISHAFGFCLNAAQTYIVILTRKGWITRVPHRTRTIRPLRRA